LSSSVPIKGHQADCPANAEEMFAGRMLAGLDARLASCCPTCFHGQATIASTDAAEPSHPAEIRRVPKRLLGVLRKAANGCWGPWAGSPGVTKPGGGSTPRLTSRDCKHGTASSTHCRRSELSARSVSAPPAIHNGDRYETVQVRSFAGLRLGSCVLLRTLRTESAVALRSLASTSTGRDFATTGCSEVLASP
jgi:ribosomal protein S19